MALNPSLEGACKAIQTGGLQVLLASPNFKTPIGVSQLLLTPQNRRGFQITESIGGQTGHYKKVQLLYKQRALEAEVRNAKSCDPGTAEPRKTQEFMVSMYREVATTVSEDDIRVLCEEYSDFVTLGNSASAGSAQLRVMREVAEQLYAKEDALATSINKAVNGALVADVGKYLGGAVSNTYTLIQASNYATIQKGMIDMTDDLSDLGFTGTPLIAGNGVIRKALRAGQYACCNDAGQDNSQLFSNNDIIWARDEYTGTALGNANGFLAFAPGAAQMVPYNQYVGKFAGEMIGADVVRGTIPSTYFPNVDYDVRIFADGCAETYTVIMGLWFDVYTLPLDMFKVGDRMAGVNGIVKGIAAAAA